MDIITSSTGKWENKICFLENFDQHVLWRSIPPPETWKDRGKNTQRVSRDQTTQPWGWRDGSVNKALLRKHKELGLIPWPHMKVPEVVVCTHNYNPGEEETGSLGFPVSQASLLGEFRSVRKTRWLASWGMAPKVVLWHPHVCAHTNTQNIRFKENCIKVWRPQQAHDQDGVLSDNFLTLRGPWLNLCPGI